MVIANLIAYVILIIGGINWGLVGAFNFNLVTAIFGAWPSAATILIYCLVALSAVWLICSPFITNGVLYLSSSNQDNEEPLRHRQNTVE